MAQHFMTVCVVCVLCAAHNPCSAHTTLSPVIAPTTRESSGNIFHSPPAKVQFTSAYNEEYDRHQGIIMRPDDNYGRHNPRRVDENRRKYGKKPIEHVNRQVHDVFNDQETRMDSPEVLAMLGHADSLRKFEKNHVQLERRRNKRHADEEERYFLKKIFNTYGDGESLTMDGFEAMIKKLGLLQLITNIGKQRNYVKNDSSADSERRKDETLTDVTAGRTKSKCLSRQEFFTSLAPEADLPTVTKDDTTIPGWLFERMCPVLLYHLTSNSSLERNGCVMLPDTYRDSIDFAHAENSRNMFNVWVYSTISIVVISLCGLLGVAVIPVMGKVYYHQLIQFLVALAIGTLCGDALIHLLPHAMMAPHSHEHRTLPGNMDHEEMHNLNMWKGLVAMMGLILFFFTEKALAMIAEWRKHRQRKNKLPTRVRVMRETDGTKSNSVGEKLCKHKYSSYPYCYGEITGETRDNHHEHEHNDRERMPGIDEEKPLTSDSNCASKIMKEESEKAAAADWKVDSAGNGTKKLADDVEPTVDGESYTVIIREHENKHHGHTHSHGHVHAAPESMSSVAWMVIMGDGLHNFTDGMAIGAAFAANIAGGFSTAIAVFCHELPHELGDFAVLLKAGMSAKQAVFYNMLSSVLCLFGMIFGVLMGSSPETTSWIFAAAAGMFIYIALVDMIPELSSGHSAEGGSRVQCVLQALGLVSGLGIMLIIALYEHDLQHIFDESKIH